MVRMGHVSGASSPRGEGKPILGRGSLQAGASLDHAHARGAYTFVPTGMISFFGSQVRPQCIMQEYGLLTYPGLSWAIVIAYHQPAIFILTLFTCRAHRGFGISITCPAVFRGRRLSQLQLLVNRVARNADQSILEAGPLHRPIRYHMVHVCVLRWGTVC